MTYQTVFEEHKGLKEIQLTNAPAGHFLNQRQAFSSDDQFLVFDNRNEDSKIGENPSIQLINIESKDIQTIYKLEIQSEFGPGVGAVSFHPKKMEIVFIHGLMNASEEKPYGFTERFAMQIDLENTNKATPMEARDIKKPFTKGALRGGSHAYSYSSDGQMVSFTYNDAVLAEEAKRNPSVQDLRTVGAFISGKRVAINGIADDESFDGERFAVLLAKVTPNPQPGSDEIIKAYEECWVGDSGYINSDGDRQKVALTFLGDVISVSGEQLTEVFIADIPDDITELIDSVNGGSITQLPAIPAGVKQRRLTFTSEKKYPGVQGPRQWLRSSPDGNAIYFYQKDDAGIVQIYAVSPNGGTIKRITENEFSADTSFSLSSDGKFLAYGAEETIYVTRVVDGRTSKILESSADSVSSLSNINWSNTGHKLAYNRKIDLAEDAYYQVFVMDLTNLLN